MKRAAVWVAVLLLSGLASAESLPGDSLRLGGGLGQNHVDGASHTSVQAFAGIDAVREARVRGGFETGYLDTGDTGNDGWWVSGFAGWAASSDVNLFGRLGVDLGSDQGGLLGIGAGYFIERNMEVRVEYVAREHSQGVQFNLAYYPRINPIP